MDYSGHGSGGSDGCLDPNDHDNAGLWECLHTGENGVRLESVWDQHREELSFADFIVIAGEAAMVVQRADLQPPLTLRSQFRYGRTTTINCDGQTPLPNPDFGCAEVERVFMNQIGLSARGSAAMMGTHSLGRARLEFSGFDGWWSGPEQSALFNNNYYLSIVLKGWAPATTKAGRHQWNRVGAGSGINRTEMMLNTDMCLAYGDVANDASVNDCCAWIMPDAFDAINDTIPDGGNKAAERIGEQNHVGKQFCGEVIPEEVDVNKESFDNILEWCCIKDTPGPRADCGNPSELKGIAAADVLEFAVDAGAWIAEFQSAWKHATEVGMEHQLFTPA